MISVSLNELGKKTLILCSVLGLSILSIRAVAQNTSGHDHDKDAHEAHSSSSQKASESKKPDEAPGDPYTLPVCVVTGQKLDAMGKPVIYDNEGREIRFCCASCVKKFEANPETYIEKIDEKIVEQQMPVYPSDICIVSGEKLGGKMGEPVDYVYQNRLVRFCCKGCVKMFEADPEKHLSKLDTVAVAKQLKDYPADTCVVSGDKLDGSHGKVIDVVVAGRLVRLCCEGCKAPLRNDPLTYLSKLYPTDGESEHAGSHTSKEKKSDEHAGHNH